MTTSYSNDESELERLFERLRYQRGNAFFCVTALPYRHYEIAENLSSRFPPNETQIIDFSRSGVNPRFSSSLLASRIEPCVRNVFLANFQVSSGGLADDEFFQIINLSRDALAKIPCSLIFMMPLYFRVRIARKAPDFNAFFLYRADFTQQRPLNGPRREPRLSAQTRDVGYNAVERELLDYQREQFDQLVDQKSRQAFDVIMQILKLNDSARALHAVESRRFYAEFCELLPHYENELENSAFDIAYIFDCQGDYDKALEWYDKALVICEKKPEPEHFGAATLYNNIAGVYANQGDYNKALELYMKALGICEKELGTEHPETATVHSNIAGVYENQYKYDKALEQYKKALVIREKELGTEHPDTARVYNNIAVVYEDQGEYDKALDLYEKALDILVKLVGTEHPDTARAYSNIAGVYESQGDYAKALILHEEALVIREKILGTEHQDTVASKRYLYKLRKRISGTAGE